MGACRVHRNGALCTDRAASAILSALLVLLFVVHRPKLRLGLRQHRREQVRPHFKEKPVLQFAQLQRYPDALVRVELLGFPTSEPDPVSSRILFVNS